MRDNWTLSDYIEELIWLEDEEIDATSLKQEITNKFNKEERKAAFLIF
jgi:hypothetical protein